MTVVSLKPRVLGALNQSDHIKGIHNILTTFVPLEQKFKIQEAISSRRLIITCYLRQWAKRKKECQNKNKI